MSYTVTCPQCHEENAGYQFSCIKCGTNIIDVPREYHADPNEIEAEINRLRRTHKTTDKDDFRDAIFEGMQALQRIGKPALPRLIDLLLDENEWQGLRARVAGTLAMIGDPTAIPPLIKTLRDPDAFIRWHIVKALEDIGDSTAIPELERLAADDTGEFLIAQSVVTVKEAAQKAIIQIKSRQK
jgi:HEAT repeat protein